MTRSRTVLLYGLILADMFLGIPAMVYVLVSRGPRAYARALRDAGDKIDAALTAHGIQ